MANQLHITVVASPNVNVSLDTEAQLLKAALLYADEVTLYSPNLSILASVLGITQLSEDDRIAFIVQVAPHLRSNMTVAQLNKAYEQYRRLRRKKYGYTKKELEIMEQFQSTLTQGWEEMTEQIEAMAEKAGVNTIAPAIRSGLVKLHPFDLSSNLNTGDTFIHSFQEFISDAIVSPDTYPLLDDTIAKLVQSAIKEGQLRPSTIRTANSRHVGLSKEILQRLPLFDEVALDELLDIRKELSPYLVRFRAAMIKYSEMIESAVWDQDFPIEAQHVFDKEVGPAIRDMEEAVKGNSFLKNLLYKVVSDPKVIAPMLGMVVAQPIDLGTLLGHIAPALLGTAAAAEILKDVAETVQAQSKKKAEIEQNQLYLLYKAQQLLAE
jgi:hypothetical protein